jgi:hypothetical protein
MFGTDSPTTELAVYDSLNNKASTDFLLAGTKSPTAGLIPPRPKVPRVPGLRWRRSGTRSPATGPIPPLPKLARHLRLYRISLLQQRIASSQLGGMGPIPLRPKCLSIPGFVKFQTGPTQFHLTWTGSGTNMSSDRNGAGSLGRAGPIPLYDRDSVILSRNGRRDQFPHRWWDQFPHAESPIKAQIAQGLPRARTGCQASNRRETDNGVATIVERPTRPSGRRFGVTSDLRTFFAAL